MKNTNIAPAPSPARPPQLLQDSGVANGEVRGAKNLAEEDRLSFPLAIGTFNNRTLSKDHQIDFLITELDKVKLDVIAIQETKRKEELNAKWRDGSQIFLGAAKNANQGGIGFIIRPKFTDKIISCSISSLRVGKLVLHIDKISTLKVISCYAPTFSASDDEIEKFYDEISEALQERTTYTFVCGDFNAKLGKGLPEEKFIGPFGLGKRNERGEKLAEFVERERLYVMNSFYKKRQGKRWTWQGPNISVKNEIDFILTKCKRLVNDIETIGKKFFDTSSDHRPVRARIVINLKNERKIRAKSNHAHRREVIDQTKLQTSIENTPWTKLETIDEDYSMFIENINKCKKTSSTPIPKSSRNRLSQETLDLLRKRRDLKSSSTNSVEYTIISKLIRKKIQEDYDNYRLNKQREVVTAKCSLKKLEREMTMKQPIPTGFLDENNILKTKRPEMEDIVSSFYNNLYASKVKIPDPMIPEALEVPNILVHEVEKAAKQMQNGRSAGIDKITIEEIKYGGDVLYKEIAERITWYLNECKIPSAWKTSKTILLPKKGNQNDIKNYRPICLLSHLYKLTTRVVLNRIQKTLEENNGVEQAGFRRGYSTIDHIHTITQLTEKCNEYRIPLCYLFIDFKKAFDTLEHNAILESLIDQGIEPTYVKFIKEINKNTNTKITLFEKPITININRGVRQGDVISPNLFICALESMLRKTKLRGGIKIDGLYLKILLFADDIVLVAKHPNQLKNMLTQINVTCQKYGLSIHPDKTMWMRNQYCPDHTIRLNKNLIAQVESYKYLGQTVRMDNDIKQELINRKRAAWIAFNKIKPMLTDQSINITLRADLFNSHILPALTYGSETWNTTKIEENGLRTTQRAMERRMINVSKKDHIRSEVIRERSGIKDVIQNIYTIKRRWAGHVARFKDDRWTARTTNWIPRQFKRSRGRPALRWEDPIVKVAGKTWKRDAQDRELWSYCDLHQWRQSSISIDEITGPSR